jgi:hypothetical protein
VHGEVPAMQVLKGKIEERYKLEVVLPSAGTGSRWGRTECSQASAATSGPKPVCFPV